MIYIVVHACVIDDFSKNILLSQLQRIKDSGICTDPEFRELHIVVLGPDVSWFENDKASIFEKATPITMRHSPDVTIHEKWALGKVYTLSREHPNARILYIHTKGVRWRNLVEQARDWRRMMEYFLIDGYERCLNLMYSGKYDTVGCNLRRIGIIPSDPTFAHYSGNFWWATAKYINTINEDPNDFASCYSPEMTEGWIGRGPMWRPACLHQSWTNHYIGTYPESRYIESPEPELMQIVSAWKPFYSFCQWLVCFIIPGITVELGVDWGFSAIALSINNPGYVYGVDHFQGDPQTGTRDPETTYRTVMQNCERFQLPNLKIIRKSFAEAAKEFSSIVTLKTSEIDILHIDGVHTAKAVQADFEQWVPFLTKRSVVLFHGMGYRNQDFGVLTFFESLNEGYRFIIKDGDGLGIWTYNEAVAKAIRTTFPDITCYKYVSPYRVGILLPITVDVQPNISYLKQTAAQERLAVYKKSIKQWSETLPDTCPLVVVESSGSHAFQDYQKEFEKMALPNVEFICYREAAVSREKGHLECLAIKYGIENSVLLKEVSHIIKVTGRYYIPKLLSHIPASPNWNYMSQDNPKRCQVVGFKKDYYLSLFDPYGINENYILEFALINRSAKLSNRLKFPPLPIPATLCGGFMNIVTEL